MLGADALSLVSNFTLKMLNERLSLAKSLKESKLASFSIFTENIRLAVQMSIDSDAGEHESNIGQTLDSIKWIRAN